MGVLVHALSFAATLGALQLWLSRRGPLDVLTFSAVGAVAHVVLGMLLFGRALLAQAGRSWPAAAWIPAMALGLFASGAVLSLAWYGVVRGVEAWIRRRLSSRQARRER